MKRILIIEDDPAILKGLQVALKEEHYHVESESDGVFGYENARNHQFDLLILDLMLPGKNGQQICRDLRGEGITTPIIMLTSKKEEADKVLGLEIGADDYVTKPFSILELKARIRAQLRRGGLENEKKDIYRFGKIEIDFKKQITLRNNKPVKLSAKEYEILQYFIKLDVNCFLFELSFAFPPTPSSSVSISGLSLSESTFVPKLVFVLSSPDSMF